MPTRLHVSRRLLAAIAAAVLALFGALVLISWVNNADARARAGEQLVPVLVVDHQVTAGSAASGLAGSVSVKQVPARLAATGSVSSLADLKGKVANADLLPGEQLVTGRFADPATQRPAGTVAVPEGMVEVSVSLEPQRAVGGVLKAGDKVGVQLTNPTSPDGVVTTSVVRVLHDVLVTRTPGDTSAAKLDPNAASIVTLAVSRQDATDVVRGATAKALWLSLEVPGVGTGSGSSATSTSTTATFSTGGSK
jgi:pilus assembly protein CpaB